MNPVPPSLLRSAAGPLGTLIFCLALPVGAQTTTVRETQESDLRTGPADERPDLAQGVDTSQSKLEIASAETMDRGLRKLAGQTVHGVNGEKLGTIKDFVIDKKSGEVVYAVVSSGGVLGAGDTLRLVPVTALRPAPAGSDGYTIKIGRAGFDRSPALLEEAFESDIIHVSEDQKRQLADIHRNASHPDNRASIARSDDAGALAGRATEEDRAQLNRPLATPLPSRAAERAASPYVRASSLRGQEIHSQGQEIGEIEEVIIDLRRQRAAALVDLDDAAFTAERKVLLPVRELSLADTERQIATTLTRQDFQQAIASRTDAALAQNDASRSSRSGATEEQLTPTGRTSAEQDPYAAANSTLASAARSARQALDNHAALATADIRVTPENGRIVLRGSVRSAELKERAEDAVEDAASGIRIDNQLAVEPR